MTITINDVFLTIKFDNERQEKEIKKILTWKDESKAFSTAGYNPRFVKDVCFLKYLKKSNLWCCFAGFAKELLVFCKENNLPIEIKDERTHFPFQTEEFDYRSFFPFDYNDHQVRALQAMKKTNRGIIKALTSAGKSAIISAYIRMSGLKTLILVDRTLLATQLRDTLIKDKIDCGLVCGGSNICKDVTIATIQSIKKLDGREYNCIISDELHRHSAKSFIDFYKTIKATYWFGFSGTPFNGSYLAFAMIRQFFGSIIINIGAEELIENKVITPPKIKFISVECPQTIDWQSAYDICIVNNKERNNQILKIIKEYKTGICIIVTRIEHGIILQNELPNSVFISGDTSNDERREVLKKFEKNEVKILIASEILKEGISINNIQVLINASGGKSLSSFLQKCGRSLRKHPDKEFAYIYDFDDFGNRFTANHSNKRKKMFLNQFGKVAFLES